MAGAIADELGENVTIPALSSNVTISGAEIFVDLAGVIDVTAEIAKKSKDIQKLEGFIQSKSAKLSNASFILKAPQEVLTKERESLADLQKQLTAAKEALDLLEKQKG